MWRLLQVQSVQLLSRVQLFVTPWTAACQASLSITNSQSLLKLTSIESVMPSNHLILCHPLLLPPSVFPSIMVFSNESVLHIIWPKYWSFSFSISPPNEYSGLISFRIIWVSKLRPQSSRLRFPTSAPLSVAPGATRSQVLCAHDSGSQLPLPVLSVRSAVNKEPWSPEPNHSRV